MSGKPPTHPKSVNKTRKNKLIQDTGIFGSIDVIVKFKRDPNTYNIIGKVTKLDGTVKTIVLSTNEAIETTLKAIENNRPVKFKVIQANKSMVIKSYRITEEAAKQFLKLIS